MSKQFEIRSAILVCLRADRSVKEISEFCNIPYSTVYDVKKRFENEMGCGKTIKLITPDKAPHKRRSDQMGNDVIAN